MDSPEDLFRKALIENAFIIAREAGFTDTYVAEHVYEKLTQEALDELSFDTCNKIRNILGIKKKESSSSVPICEVFRKLRSIKK